ncbi:hypothetical protein PsYK624_066010 [Phanerochaete sordida]|uniref:Uncharacterized protein n=1 Tax=Phanerochaete sordida TaxID=48140 RepID=A0A9P3GAP7_9APHY|nr:hypothetical protein PsYK624_066010 [Phanerochaete sordida]
MDGLVLVLTWHKTFRQWRDARNLNISLSASTCLLRDGTWYFCGLLAMNIAEMATIRTVGTPLSSCLVQVLPSALVNHFIINLRSLNPANASMSGEPPLSQISSLHIRAPNSFLGNIGEDLDYGEGSFREEDGTERSFTSGSFAQDISTTVSSEKLDAIETPSIRGMAA